MSEARTAAMVMSQAGMETRLTLRRGESTLVTLIIPAALLVFFASTKILPAAGRSTGFLLAGTLTLAVISTGLVSLGIATAYERAFGVLKRLGVTPLSRADLIAAKILSVLAVEVIQVVLLIVVALLFGWRPLESAWLAMPVLLLGTACFAGLGLLMAGTVRAEATLAGANGAFLFFLLLGGLYLPVMDLPPVLRALASILPAEPMADLLRSALQGGSFHAGSLMALVLWTVLAPLVASRTFRWDT